MVKQKGSEPLGALETQRPLSTLDTRETQGSLGPLETPVATLKHWIKTHSQVKISCREISVQ